MIKRQKTVLIISIISLLLISLIVFAYFYLTRDKQTDSIPKDCKMWFDGCNTCTIDKDGTSLCTLLYCNPEDYDEPKCLVYWDVSEDRESNRMYEDCITWFDGCNTCTRDEDGIIMCTERYCNPEDYEESKCLD
jgi:hypothetical protein